MSFHIAEVDLFGGPETSFSTFWDGTLDIERERSLMLFGYDDLSSNDLPSRVASLRQDSDVRRLVLLAVAGDAPTGPLGPRGYRVVPATGDATIAPGSVLGSMVATVPVIDNTHMGQMDLGVRAESQRRGVGGALLEAAEAYLRSEDRSTFLAWSTVTAATEDDEHSIVDPVGTIRISTRDDVVRFALHHGYEFGQAERHSVQPLPVPSDVLAAALTEGETRGEGYELVQFVGLPPADLVEGLAPLFSAMSTDPPLAAVDWRPEVWDADRVVRAYEHMMIGRDVYTTLARHLATGELVAFTQVKGVQTKPEVCFQDNTLVLSGHRGHALGLWVKAANCAYISRERPSSRRVHTWNADENDYMLAINTRLGYRLESIAAAWQKVDN